MSNINLSIYQLKKNTQEVSMNSLDEKYYECV